jgi:hypothetical protein
MFFLMEEPMSNPKKKFEYDDFVDLFEKAAEEASRDQVPVSAKLEEPCLAWARAMGDQGANLEELGTQVWLGCADHWDLSDDDDEDKDDDEGQLTTVDFDMCLTPLAWAVAQGLTRTVEALLEMGANPEFSFNLSDCGGEDVEIAILDLAAGWSEAGYRSSDCLGLIGSAIEAREIAKSTMKGKPGPKASGL